MIKKFFVGAGNYFRWDIYRRLLPYMLPYKWPMLLVLAIQLIYTGLGLLEPWAMEVIIDSAPGHSPVPGWVARVFPFLASGSGVAILVFAVVSMLALRIGWIL